MANADGTRQLVRRYAGEVMDQVAPMMEDALRVAAPLGQTGETVRGVKVERTGGGNSFGLHAISTGKGGDFVEDGTKPHLIYPQVARALRFMAGSARISTAAPNQRLATKGGGVVFAKVVHHPGMPARPWFRPVVELFGDFLERAAARVRV